MDIIDLKSIEELREVFKKESELTFLDESMSMTDIYECDFQYTFRVYKHGNTDKFYRLKK